MRYPDGVQRVYERGHRHAGQAIPDADKLIFRNMNVAYLDVETKENKDMGLWLETVPIGLKINDINPVPGQPGIHPGMVMVMLNGVTLANSEPTEQDERAFYTRVLDRIFQGV